MMVTIVTENGTTVTGKLVTTKKVTPVIDRTYKLTSTCPTSFKGKQRQIVHDILRSDPDKFWTVQEVTTLSTEKGLSTVGGVLESVRYHLHNLKISSFVEEK